MLAHTVTILLEEADGENIRTINRSHHCKKQKKQSFQTHNIITFLFIFSSNILINNYLRLSIQFTTVA